MTTIKCCVSLELGSPVLFYRQGDALGVFSWADGHCYATSAYMRSLPRTDDATASAFVAKYQDYLRTLPDMGEVVCVAVSRIRI